MILTFLVKVLLALLHICYVANVCYFPLFNLISFVANVLKLTGINKIQSISNGTFSIPFVFF